MNKRKKSPEKKLPILSLFFVLFIVFLSAYPANAQEADRSGWQTIKESLDWQTMKTSLKTFEQKAVLLLDSSIIKYEAWENKKLWSGSSKNYLATFSDSLANVVGLTVQPRSIAINLLKLLAFMQFLFIQPFVLGIPRRRQARWGEVYDSVTKKPLGYTTVRLLGKDGAVIQSKVTDSLGRYAFMTGPGRYAIEIVNQAYKFPSQYLKNNLSDGRYAELYQGGTMRISSEEGIIAVNIPVDPINSKLRPQKLLNERFFNFFLKSLAWFGLLITLAAFLVYPDLDMGIFLMLQVVVFTIERIKAYTFKIKSWGVVIDGETQKPVEHVLARLYNYEYNKLIASQLTDKCGRYYFLAGGNEYYVTFEHPQYQTEKSSKIDLTAKQAATVTLDIALKKMQGVQNNVAVPAPVQGGATEQTTVQNNAAITNNIPAPLPPAEEKPQD